MAAEAISRGSNPTEETYCRFTRFVEWIADHKFARPIKGDTFDVFLYQARLHSCHAQVTDYWHDREAEREKYPTERYPGFKECRRAADRYTFKLGDA